MLGSPLCFLMGPLTWSEVPGALLPVFRVRLGAVEHAGLPLEVPWVHQRPLCSLGMNSGIRPSEVLSNTIYQCVTSGRLVHSLCLNFPICECIKGWNPSSGGVAEDRMRPCVGVWACLKSSVTPSYFQPLEATRLALGEGYNVCRFSPHFSLSPSSAKAPLPLCLMICEL